nr:Xaa-Pro peptidase family protein [Agrobacterium vitis]
MSEFRSRLTAVKNEMARRGIDILLVSEPPNQNYLTGYDAYSFYTPQLVIVSLEREQPIWVGRPMDRVSASMTTYLDDVNIRTYPETHVHSSQYSAFEAMSDIVKEIGGEKARIGVEMGGYYYSGQAHVDFTRSLPQAQFVNADLLIGWIRLVKSRAEVNVMKQAGQIADAAMQRVTEFAASGIRECDLAAVIYQRQISGTADFGGSYPCCPPDLCIGRRSIAPHAAWTDEPIPEATVINLELSGCRHRYQVNLARTIVIGTPPPGFSELAKVALEGLEVALEAVKPGRTCSDVAHAFHQVLIRYGIDKASRIGYPTGVAYPPAVGERTASIRKGDVTVLQPGMVFHLMPGLWSEHAGVTITQSVVVTDGGVEPLTNIPRELFLR